MRQGSRDTAVIEPQTRMFRQCRERASRSTAIHRIERVESGELSRGPVAIVRERHGALQSIGSIALEAGVESGELSRGPMACRQDKGI